VAEAEEPWEEEPPDTRRRARERLAEAASAAHLRFGPLFAAKLYEGFVVDETAERVSMTWHPEAPVTLTAMPAVPPDAVARDLRGDLARLAALPPDDRARFQLAARWFVRGHEAETPIDRYLSWWVVLEVYCRERNAKPDVISERLSADLHRQVAPADIARRFGLERLNRLRNDIAHHGQIPATDKDRDRFDEESTRLQAVAAICLRLLGRLPMGPAVEEWTRPTSKPGS